MNLGEQRQTGPAISSQQRDTTQAWKEESRETLINLGCFCASPQSSDGKTIFAVNGPILIKKINAVRWALMPRPLGAPELPDIFVSVSCHTASMPAKHCLDLGKLWSPEVIRGYSEIP